jgi:iron complex outermembrane recepter protein
MIKKILNVFFFFCVSFGFSQVKISGVITDSSGSAVSFATIGLISLPDSSIIKGTLTDESGVYLFQVNNFGRYALKIASIGYQVKISEEISIDSLSNKNINLNVKLHSSSIRLDEITVSQIKRVVEFKNGNIIVNVENSPLAKGNSVYDLFLKLPGVTIDNDEILLNGKSGVKIILDGRLLQLSGMQLFNLLKSMSSELVQTIELLKNPPAKYDAAGTSGFISIKTKKAKLLGFSSSIYTSNSQGFYARSMSGIDLNYKAKKIVLFSNIGYNYSYYQSMEKFDKKFDNNGIKTEFNGDGSIKDLEKNLNYKVGADWQVNEKNLIGFKIDGGPGSYLSNSSGSNYVLGYNSLGFDHLNSSISNPDVWNSTNYNVNAEHRFDTLGTVLNFTSDYTFLTEKYTSDISNLFLNADNTGALPDNIYKSNNISQSKILASKLDFSKVLKEKTIIEFGLKSSFIGISNNYLFERKDNTTGTYNKDTALSNNYIYNEQTFAAYVNYNRSFKKANIQLGLRGENTNLIGKNTDKAFELSRHYYNLFPTISFEYSGFKNSTFQFNINRRIDRPAYGDLNPFRYYREQYSYRVGNPYLLPHYSNTAEIAHNYKDIVTNTLTYTRINNVMLDYTEQNDSTKVTTQTIKNMQYSNYLAYSFFIRHDLKKWWNASVNGLVSYIEYLGDVNGSVFNTKGVYYYGMFTNSFLVFKKTKFEILGSYKGPKNTGLIQVKPRWMISLAIKQSFYDGKLDCTFGINDIFYTLITRTYVDFNNQNWSYYRTNDTRRFLLSINYNFGRNKIVERETNSNQQEKDRLNH